MKSMLVEELHRLTKHQIGDLLGITQQEVNRISKVELLALLNDAITNHRSLLKKAYQRYDKELGMHPSKVEEYLMITKTERLRWTKEKKLHVVDYSVLKKWGKTLKVPIYNSYQIQNLTEKQIEIWRLEHQQRTEAARKKAAKKAVQTRKKNQSIQKEFYEKTFKKVVLEWFAINGKLGASLLLAYWTMWVSRWAKEFQLLAQTARSKKNEYLHKKEQFYEMKNEAIRRLALSPYTKTEFYQAPNADKITSLKFCPNHYELWQLQREFAYLSKWDFYYSHHSTINQCRLCTVDIEEDYYSLYFTSIEQNEYRFSFHTPYPIGKSFFPPKDSLPHVLHEEKEGLFRFGRALQDEEKIIFKEKEVIKHFHDAVIKFDLYMKQE